MTIEKYSDERVLKIAECGCFKPAWLQTSHNDLINLLFNKVKFKNTDYCLLINFTKKTLNYFNLKGLSIAICENQIEKSKVEIIWNKNNELFDFVFTPEEFENWKIDMKFNNIIMNPPYGKNLHLNIIKSAIKHLAENGKCANLSPYFLRSNELGLLKDVKEYLFKRMESQEIITAEEADKNFHIYSTCDLAVSVFTKNESNSNDYPSEDNKTIILNKFRNKKKVKSIRSMIWKTEGQYQVTIQGDYGYAKRWHYTLEQMLTGNANAQMKFKTEFEQKNFIKITTSLLPYKFIYILDEKAAIPAHLPWIGDIINSRTGKRGYESEWTNEDFYKYFDITKEEQQLIEETIEKHK